MSLNLREGFQLPHIHRLNQLAVEGAETMQTGIYKDPKVTNLLLRVAFHHPRNHSSQMGFGSIRGRAICLGNAVFRGVTSVLRAAYATLLVFGCIFPGREDRWLNAKETLLLSGLDFIESLTSAVGVIIPHFGIVNMRFYHIQSVGNPRFLSEYDRQHELMMSLPNQKIYSDLKPVSFEVGEKVLSRVVKRVLFNAS